MYKKYVTTKKDSKKRYKRCNEQKKFRHYSKQKPRIQVQFQLQMHLIHPFLILHELLHRCIKYGLLFLIHHMFVSLRLMHQLPRVLVFIQMIYLLQSQLMVCIRFFNQKYYILFFMLFLQLLKHNNLLKQTQSQFLNQNLKTL